MNFNTAHVEIVNADFEIRKLPRYNCKAKIRVIIMLLAYFIVRANSLGLPTKTSSNTLITNNRVYNNNHENFSEPGGGFENFVPSGSGILCCWYWITQPWQKITMS